MIPVFADTGYWVALLNRRDTLHPKVIRLSQALRDRPIVTSEMVLTELLNDFSKRGIQSRRLAITLTRDLKQSDNVTIVDQSAELFARSLELYEQRLDKDWSQTDCASFLIMQQYQIAEALAYDRHFEQAGFIALMRSQA
jgi:uncharacterized protein